MSGLSYGIVGTGALGGYYGACLHHSGRETHFLLNRDYQHVVAHGLRVESKPRGDMSIASPHAYNDPKKMPPCDVVLVCLKSTSNAVLPDILPHVLKDDGVAVVLENGLGVEAEVAAIVGHDRVMGGLAFLCSNKLGPGHIEHQDYGLVRLGEYDAGGAARGISDRMRAIGADFDAAGIGTTLEEDLVLARWKKLVWNIPYNGLTVVMDTTTDQLMADNATRGLCQALMEEVAAGAAGLGRVIDDAFIGQMLSYTDEMVAYLPSMKLDYDAKRPLEVQAIYGEPLRVASEAGVPMPRIDALYRMLFFMDKRNLASS